MWEWCVAQVSLTQSEYTQLLNPPALQQLQTSTHLQMKVLRTSCSLLFSEAFRLFFIDHKQVFFIFLKKMQKKKRKGKKAPVEKKLTDLELGIRGYGSK